MIDEPNEWVNEHIDLQKIFFFFLDNGIRPLHQRWEAGRQDIYKSIYTIQAGKAKLEEIWNPMLAEN